MPHFYFHVHDGRGILDEDGQELASLDIAQSQAVCIAAAMLRDDAREFWRDGKWRMDVTDQAGLTLFSLVMVGTVSPAMRSDQTQAAWAAALVSVPGRKPSGLELRLTGPNR